MSNRDIEISVRLTADGKGLVGEARVVRDALGGVGDATRKATNDSAGLTAQTRQQSAATGQAGASLGNLKTGLIAAAGAYVTLGAGVTAASASFKGFVDFDRQLAGVSTLIEGTVVQMDALEFASRSLGATYGKMPVEQAKTFYQVISSGVTDVGKATELLDEANKLSVAGMADLFATADSMTSIMNAYGTGVKSAADVSDILFIGTLAGKTTIDELASSLGRVSPIAESVGVGFDELTSAISALTLGGISTAESVTGVRAILAAVIKPSSEAVEVAKALGIQFDSAAIKAKGFGGFMEDLVAKTQGSQEALGLLFGGVEAIVPALALAGKAGDSYNSIMQMMADRTGATQTAFEKMAASPGFKVDRLMSSIGDAAITLGDSLAGFLIPAAEGATRALRDLFGVKNLSAIDKQKQSIAEMRAEMDSMGNRKHIPLIGGLIFDKKQADLLKQQIEDATTDLAKMSESARESAQAGNAVTQSIKNESDAKSGLAKVNQILAGLKAEGTDKTRESTKANDREVESSTRIIAALRLETEQIGLNVIQKKMLSAAAEAAKAPTQALAQEIMASAQAWGIATQQQEALMAAEKERITALQEIEKAEKAVARASEESAREAVAEWNQLWGGVEQTAKTSFIQFAAHGKSAMQSIGESIKLSIIDVLYQLTVRKWIINIGESIGGLAGSGAASAGGLDMLSAGSSLLSSGSGIRSMIGRGASALGLSSFSAGASGAASAGVFGPGGIGYLSGVGANAGAAVAGGAEFGAMATMGSTFAAAAGPLVAIAIAYQLTRMFAGDKLIGGGVGKVLSYVPVIGGLLNGLFGHGPMKFRQQVAIGMASEQGFDGRVTDVYRAKGGLLVGNKHKELAAGNQDELLKLFDTAITGYAASAKQFADTLGISKDAITGYSKEIRLESEKGKTLTEEAINAMLAGIGDDFARGLIPQIDELSKSGETAYATLSRLNTEFVTLSDAAATVLGKTVADARAFVTGASYGDRTAFVDAAGGVDALNQKVAFFAQNFLTEADRLAPAQEKLNEELNKLGVSTNLTKEQYKDLVQSFGQLNGVSSETLQALLNLAPAFISVTDSAKSAANAALGNAFADLQRSVDFERTRITNEYNTALESTNTRIQDITESIGKLRTLSEALKSTVSALRPLSRDQAKQQIQDAINTARSGGNLPSADSLREALGVLGNKSTSGFRSSFEYEREQAKTANLVGELGSLTDAQLTLEERSLSALEAQRDRLTDGFKAEMIRLDGILAQGQGQIDVMNGLSTSILSLTEAIAAMNLASAQVSAGAAAPSGALSILRGAGNSAITGDQIRSFVGAPGRTGDEILQAAIENGVSESQYVRETGADPAQVRAFLSVRGFASGGFHRGGLRIVGENGPELEATGPSHITSNNDLRKALNNDDVVSVLLDLITEIQTNNTYNQRVANKLDAVTTVQGGLVRLRTGT